MLCLMKNVSLLLKQNNIKSLICHVKPELFYLFSTSLPLAICLILSLFKALMLNLHLVHLPFIVYLIILLSSTPLSIINNYPTKLHLQISSPHFYSNFSNTHYKPPLITHSMMIRSKDTTIQSRAFFTSQKIQLPKTIKEDLRDKG